MEAKYGVGEIPILNKFTIGIEHHAGYVQISLQIWTKMVAVG